MWEALANDLMRTGCSSYRSAVELHDLIGRVLYRLRSGTRRRTKAELRGRLRDFRRRLCREWRFPKGPSRHHPSSS